MWRALYINVDKLSHQSASLQKCIDLAFKNVNSLGGMGGHDGVFLSKHPSISEYTVSQYCCGYGHKTYAVIQKIK